VELKNQRQLKRRNFYTSQQEHRQIVNLYERGLTLKKVATKVGRDVKTVERTLRKLGVVKRRHGGSKKKYSPQDRQRMVDLYKSGLSQREVSTKLGCSVDTVKIVFRELSVQSRPGSFLPKFSEQDCQRIIAMYQDGKTQTEIAATFGCSQLTVASTLVKHGIERHSRRRPSRFSDEERNLMMEMYQNGATKKAIAKKFDCSSSLVQHFLGKQVHRRNVVPMPTVVDSGKKRQKLDDLIRDYWQTDNRAVEMMLFPQETRMQILKHVSDAFQYACETLATK